MPCNQMGATERLPTASDFGILKSKATAAVEFVSVQPKSIFCSDCDVGRPSSFQPHGTPDRAAHQGERWSVPLRSHHSSTVMADPVVLDPYQEACISSFRAGKNVGVFGSAGHGKSVVLRAIVADAVARQGPQAVAVCSWYGAAADLIGGHTLHSFFSCGITLLDPDVFLAAAKRRDGLARKLRDVRVLVVDEVFTMTASWLVVFLRVLRGLAPSAAQVHPAGGVQVVGTRSPVPFLPAFRSCTRTGARSCGGHASY